jgi:hypothetical protein
VRRDAKADANQPAVVAALRSVGAKVEHTHQVGGGFPDLVVWARGRTFLAEVKMPGESLNKQQAEFFAAWPGEIHILRTPEEAIKAAIGEESMR